MRHRHPQGSYLAKALMEKAKILFSTAVAAPYYDYQALKKRNQ
jgi:hypothetical protein